MKTQYNILSCILLLILTSVILPVRAQQTYPVNGPHNEKPAYYALVNATIYIDAQTRIENAGILFRDGVIENVGVNIAIPKGVTVIDAKGKFIYPSFIDLYSNYGVSWGPPANRGNESGQQYVSQRSGAFGWNEAIRSDVNAAAFFSPDEKRSKGYLEGGFGATLSGVQDGICRGTSALVLTSKTNKNTGVLIPRAASGFSFNKGSSTQDYPGSLMGSIALIRQTYYDAQWYKNQSAEKNLTLESFNALAGLPSVFEVDNKLSVLRADKIGDEFGLTYIVKGAGDEYQRLNEIRDAKVPLIIPINFPKPFDVEDPFMTQYISLSDMKHWEMAPANAKLLARAGISFSFTLSGCSDGNEFLKNLRKCVQYGLDEKTALDALTRIPARLIRAEHLLGSLQKNKLANFIVCDKPLFDKECIVLENWVQGQQHSINQPAQSELRGKYSLTLKGYENYILKIEGEQNKPSISLLGPDTLKVNANVQAETLNLIFKRSKKSDETIRINAWVEKTSNRNDTLYVSDISGQAQLADGSFTPFRAHWTEAVKSEKKKKDSIPVINLGDIVYPFTDYGWKTAPQPENILFKNVSVWSNEAGGILKETDVAIGNGKITAIGKNLSAGNAKVIDGSGKHLTNGIIDEHSHIAIFRGVNECTQAVTSEVRIGDVVYSEDINIYRQLAGGVTAAQLLHGSCNPIGGQSALIKLRWGAAPEKMKIEGADGFIKFALGENVKQSNWGHETDRYPQTRMGVEQVYYNAFIRAKEYEKRMKQNPALTRKDLELETLVEILSRKRFITCHSYVQSEINMLMHVADSMGFKVNTFTHILEGYKVADKMKEHGVCASTFADWWAYKYEVIEAIPYNAALMTKVGLTVAINSDDAEMGRRLNQEAAKTIKYGGMSEEEAWKMVTLHPAKMLHLDNRLGSIKPGKDADLVLWSDNPLSVYARPEMTFVDGICYFSLANDEQLRLYIRAERQRLINKMLAAKQAGEKTEKRISHIEEEFHCEN